MIDGGFRMVLEVCEFSLQFGHLDVWWPDRYGGGTEKHHSVAGVDEWKEIEAGDVWFGIECAATMEGVVVFEGVKWLKGFIIAR